MPKNRKQRQNANRFKLAVESTPEVSHCYQSGLRALGEHSQKVSPADTSKCLGSLDIDTCTTRLYPNANRWDYALAYDSKVYFVEVHSAETSEVSKVLLKLQWLKDWLNQKAPEIKNLKAEQPYFGIQSSKFNILKNSPQARQIAQVGLRPISKLSLD